MPLRALPPQTSCSTRAAPLESCRKRSRLKWSPRRRGAPGGELRTGGEHAAAGADERASGKRAPEIEHDELAPPEARVIPAPEQAHVLPGRDLAAGERRLGKRIEQGMN